MRRPGRGVCQSFFHTCAEPLVVSGLRLADLFLPGGEFLVRHREGFAQKIFDEPIAFSGREMAGFFEEFSGGAGHGEIVARIGI